ncbi:Modification methylase PaeR7I [Pseudomonas sp. THAF187a]|uniref:Eco57I restriction-modification methylase domain-containing protein n=1 Tax=unclassified Pseudomonas TaxID=196821 RepID=UPI00126786B5|nr:MULTISPECIES: Eco57I restriction-modification methylase domain-containing protein [unclassified Pseudomonas]QFT20979.1 Modification methylase PaeR7I [Pseudomonas sp. THAF187a]QFT41168.1 Modification methylase PaeR7I [Pseudomonas sp. THAF42]
MSEKNAALLQSIQDSLQNLASESLAEGAAALLSVLGYSSDKTADLGYSAEELLENIEQFRPELGGISRAKVQADRWISCAFLFQLTNDEIPSLALGQAPLGANGKLVESQIESFVFLAIDLQGEQWSRTQLATIARELNKRFPMPAIILFRQEALLSLAVIDRRQHLRDASRDVIDSRITVIKDVRLTSPHRAHIDILASLALAKLGDKRRPSNFRELYDAWIGTLSTQKLNKEFYQQLAWWYLWATKEVEFPKGGGEKREDRNTIGVIRLLTRLIFVWFIKERGLVPEALFERNALRSLLKQAPDAAPDESNYYHAILQNLFFATLNQEMGGERRWATTGSGMKNDYLISLIYRYQEAFKHPDTVLQDCFANVPFLNGGLFECLDEQLSDDDLARRPELKKLVVQEGNGSVLRIDGFSRRTDAQAKVPNKLFFGGTEDAALNTEFETKGKRYPIKGLIDLLDSYRFTVDENTPLDEEVALDPELLGKVFENLLASYNPDTRSTARKQSGSFYTPREVVDYMVDEALIAYFTRHLPDGEQREQDFRQLLSHADTDHAFSEAEADALVVAIEQLKVLDPACGSGAFPMGMLAKLFVALKKLDPDNQRWREQNLAPLQQRLALAKKTPDPVQRDVEIDDAEAALEKHKKDFADPAYADYTRKLYLIEKCIFGSDIQPIAVQIAKLRFFISLIVSQPVDRSKPNWNITPLPNLETKIVAANTLFGVPRHGVQGSLLDDPAIAEKEAELRDANAAYFTSRTRATKKRRKEKVQKLHEELVALLKRDGFVTARDAERMARWDPFDQNRFADFFDVEWMFGMPRAQDNSEAVFDIVIGNPPYVRHEDIKELTPVLKGEYQYECAASRADLYVFFYERSVKLLKPHGVISFITSNKWYRAKYGENLRLFMATNTRLKNIIDFGDEAVFTAIAYPTIVIAARREKPVNPPPATDVVRALNWQQEHPVETFPFVFANENFQIPQSELKKDGWQLELPEKRKLLSHMLASGKPLGNFVNGHFYRGITTGFNDAFVISEETKNKLISADINSAELIKPYIRGRDIARWKAEPTGFYLIAFPFGFHKKLENYPAVLEHLTQFEVPLRKRGQCTSSRNGKSEGQHHWLELDNNPKESYFSAFERPKIVSTKVSVQPTFAFDTSGSYLANTAYFIAVGELGNYLLPLLNSSISGFYARSVFVGKQNGWYEVQPNALEAFPVPDPNRLQKEIIEVSGAIATAYSDSRFEQLINGLVFELFFPDELHAANIRLFDACEAAGVGKLAALQGDALAKAAEETAGIIFANDHPIYAMLFDLQALEVVRIIEGKE